MFSTLLAFAASAAADPLMCGQADLTGVNNTLVHYHQEGLAVFPCYGTAFNHQPLVVFFLLLFQMLYSSTTSTWPQQRLSLSRHVALYALVLCL